MTKPVGFDPVSGALVIVDNGVFPACTLRAGPHPTWPDRIQIDSLAGRGEQTIPWQDVTSLDGSFVPTSMDDALAYLRGEFAKRPDADIPAAEAVAFTDIPAGMPVAVSRRDGSLQIARADTYTLAFVAGLSRTATEAGFAGAATRHALTLADWTAVIGAPSLAVGQPYFLAPEGGLTPSPPALPGLCSVRVGNATGPQTFAPIEADPILL